MTPDNQEESPVEQGQTPSQPSTDETEKPQTEKKPARKAKAKRVKKEGKDRPAGAWVGWFALVIAIASGSGSYYVFSLNQANKPILKAQSQQIGTLSNKLDSLQSSLNITAQGLEKESKAREKAEAEHNALVAAMASLESKLGRTTLAWRLAEVEYLLTIANQRTTLEHDQRTAITILETADAKLQAMGDPALLVVREKISSELAALRAVDEPDIQGMALTLGSLAEAVTKWPLVDVTPPGVLGKEVEGQQRAHSWRDIPRAVWDDLKDLVRVRRHQQPVEPLLPPDQAWFLRENLQLKLEQARLALLHRETALFRQLVSEAQDWIRHFFDGDAAAVSSAMDTLDKLQTVDLSPTLPDISASLRELRTQAKRLGQQIGANEEPAL
jgi:uroporphyrin-3 C-methyltransferase